MHPCKGALRLIDSEDRRDCHSDRALLARRVDRYVAVVETNRTGFHRREAARKDHPMSIARSFQTWRQYRNTAAELNRLSQRELADLGISRSEILALARQSVR